MAWQRKISGGFLAVVGYMLSLLPSPAQRQVQAGAPKANTYVQPSVFDMLAGESPASARDGWAE
jgi:hypothetical protein